MRWERSSCNTRFEKSRSGSGRGRLAGNLLAESRVNLQRVALENLSLVLGTEPGSRVDIPLRVVKVVPCLRIDSLDRADHLRRKQDVVGRNDFREQIDPGLVVDTGVEIDVVEQQFLKWRTLHVLRH